MSGITPLQFNIDGPHPRLVIPAHDDCIWTFAILPGGRRVVTGGSCGGIVPQRVWDLDKGGQGQSLEYRGAIRLAVTWDGTRIVVARLKCGKSNRTNLSQNGLTRTGTTGLPSRRMVDSLRLWVRTWISTPWEGESRSFYQCHWLGVHVFHFLS